MLKNKLMFLFAFIFIIGFSSAAEFDNGISNYDEEHEVITFSNGCVLGLCVGDVIGQVQLKTPKDFKVARGYNHVWELDAWVYEDYNDFLKGFEFEDMANGKVKINRDIDIKILSYEDVSYPTYDKSCYFDYSNSTNGTEICERFINGSKSIKEEVWTKVTPADLKKADGKVTLRGYTDIQKGDHIDWSPLIFGVRVEHDIWAEWTEDLNVDLSAYYKLNEASGTIFDSTDNNHDGTYNGALYSQTGIINDAIGFDGTNDFIDLSPSVDFENGRAVVMWVNVDTFLTGASVYTHLYASEDIKIFLARGTYQNQIRALVDGTSAYPSGSYSDFTTGTWHLVIVNVYDNDTVEYYYDNVKRGYASPSLTNGANTFSYMGKSNAVEDQYNGYLEGDLDEVALFNRSLTPSEIDDFWNSGSGITWTDIFGFAPSVTLTSPANNSNLTSPNIDFITTVTDDQQVDNVSFYFNGVLNQTNTSGFNGTYTFSIVAQEGIGNWSILAIDNQSLENQSETFVFNFTQPPIFVDLLSPTDATTSQIPLVNMSCTAYKTEGVTQLNLTIDGIVNISITNSSIAENLTISQELNFSEGNYTWGCQAINPSTSAVSSNRTFEVLYSNPIINLFEPENDSTILIENATFIFNASDVNGLDNVTLFINGVANETNTSGVIGNYSLFRTLQDGLYNWSVSATSIFGKITNSTTRFFLLHTVEPTIVITAPTGTVPFLFAGDNVTLQYNITESGESPEHFEECWYNYNGDFEEEFLSNSTLEILGDYWNIIDGGTSNSENSLLFDSIFLGNSILRPQTISKIVIVSQFLESPNCFNESTPSNLEFTADTIGYYACLKNSDNPDFYYIIKQNDYNEASDSANFSSFNLSKNLNCTGNTTNFTYAQEQNSIIVFAKDEFGFIANATSSFSLIIEALSFNFTSEVYEGVTNTITATVKLANVSSLSEALLYYDGVNYTTTILYAGDTNTYTVSSAVPSPSVIADTNFTFGFFLTIDGTIYDPRQNNQTVLNADLGECGGISNDTILNISLVNEQTQALILGDIQIGGEIISLSSGETIGTIFTNFSNSNNGSICFSPPEAYDLYYMNAEIRYNADGYAAELYHIQNADITNGLGNLTLYDLNDNDTTIFDIVYQDSTFKFVEGAVIQLQRKYIQEGVYKTVEAPLTSNEGVAIAHIDLNSIKYRATIVKDGVILDEFDNLVFNCQSELTGECTQKLLGEINSQTDIDFDVVRDFSYDITPTNESIEISFSIPSGSSSSVNVLLVQLDQFGNKQVCNKTISSSAGSMECTFDTTIGESYIDFSISKDGVPMALQTYIVPEDSGLDWLGNNYIFILILLFSLVGMALSSPEWMIINTIITMVIAGGLWLANGLDFVMGLGNIIWLIIAGILIIAKQAKQEDG